MATYTKTVDPNGGADYTSISAWEAGEQTLYSSGDIAIADCRRTGSTSDTTTVAIGGWTAGVIPKIIINASYRHEGKIADQQAGGNYIYKLSGMSSSAFTIGVNSTEVHGLLISGWGSVGGTRAGITTGGTTVDYGVVSGCLIASPTNVASSTMYGIQLVNGCDDWKIINNIVCNVKTSLNTAYGIQSARGNLVYNNTVYNCGTGFTEGDNNNTMVYKNNVAVGNTVADWANSYAATSDYNVSSDATAPGTNKATGKTAYTDYFVDPANGDFHLKGSSYSLFGLAGTDLSGTFTTDIDGQTRTAWDIGADEYVASGGGTTYEETLYDTATTSVSLTAIASRVEALLSTIQTADSITDAVAAVESLLDFGATVSALTEVALRVESIADSATISASVVDTLLSSLEEIISDSASVQASVVDILSGSEAPSTTAIAQAAITDVTTAVESLQTIGQSADSVADVAIRTEALLTTVQTLATVTESLVSGAVETILDSASITATATDVQTMVETVLVMVSTGASAAQVAAYVDQVLTTATATASVVDAIVGAFIGAYIRGHQVNQRSFSCEVDPRSFVQQVYQRSFSHEVNPL